MVHKLYLILILLAPLSAWGLSAESISSYQKQAVEKKLWQDSQWLRLGHYRSKTFGGYISPFKGNLFIAPNGAKDPQAELLATLNLLFSDNQTQCRYLSRTIWIKKHFDIPAAEYAACEERQTWKRQLGAQELYLVFASSDLNNPGSSFGHTFLRAHNPKNVKDLDLLDYGINFAAATGTDDGALFATKGLFGFYPGVYSMLPFHQKMREYTNLEGRDLWEYKLKLTPAEVDLLIDHLLELEGGYADYYFLDDNCSRQILELIEIAKPDVNLVAHFHESTIPLDTVKVLAQEGLLQDERFRVSLQAEWRDSYAHLDRKQKKSLKEITKKITSPPQANEVSQPLADLASLQNFAPKEQAEILEASMRYLAIRDYREGKDSKDRKYQLSVARARLGAVTEAAQIEKPKSPLLSGASRALYFGYGKYDEQDYYRFKFRRAFHDLLSDDTGISAFSHLEVLSADFRYFTSDNSLNLYQFVVLKMLSTAPVNELDTPLTWTVDVGTLPKLAPYLHGGIGYSYDFAWMDKTRASLMARSENYQLANIPQTYFGLEALLMTKLSFARGVISSKYLLDNRAGLMIWDNGAGFSFDISKSEMRLELRSRDNISEAQLSLIF